MFTESQLNDIREKISIVDLISEYVVLKKSGKNFQGLCPFHQERSPSFFVNLERESFHCFGCGVGGNAFHFLMKIESLSFPESVVQLAERAGIAVEAGPAADPKKAQKHKRLFEINRQSAWFYHCLLKNLPPQDAVWTYLQQRQISTESCEAFFLGYCPPQDSGLQAFLRQKGFSASEIEASQLYKSQKEFFRGRLVFPIFRPDKKVVGFGGRLTHPQDFGPKYLNSAESDLFKKGELFYGMPLAKPAIQKNGQIIIVEGYMDAITLHSHGFTQAVAPLGTALTSHHAKMLQRLGCEIVLLFDGDNAGLQATLRALEILLASGLSPQRVAMEPGEDPDSYLRREGKLAFENLLKKRRNLLEELIDKWSKEITPGDSLAERKAKVAHKLLALIEKMPDTLTQNLYRQKVAETLELPLEWVVTSKQRTTKPNSPAPQKPKNARLWLPEEESLFEIWLKFEELRPILRQTLKPEDFCTESARGLAEKFWQLAASESPIATGAYFEVADPELIEVLSGLSLKLEGPEDAEVAKQHVAQVSLRLKEKRLRLELQALKNAKDPESVHLIQKKIHDLSRVLKNKERVYDE